MCSEAFCPLRAALTPSFLPAVQLAAHQPCVLVCLHPGPDASGVTARYSRQLACPRDLCLGSAVAMGVTHTPQQLATVCKHNTGSLCFRSPAD